MVKGVIQVEKGEIKKLFVEPALQGNSIGSALLEYAINGHNAHTLWALEKNAGYHCGQHDCKKQGWRSQKISNKKFTG